MYECVVLYPNHKSLSSYSINKHTEGHSKSKRRNGSIVSASSKFIYTRLCCALTLWECACVCIIKGAFEIWSIVRVIKVMIGGVCVRTTAPFLQWELGWVLCVTVSMGPQRLCGVIRRWMIYLGLFFEDSFQRPSATQQHISAHSIHSSVDCHRHTDCTPHVNESLKHTQLLREL